MYFDKDQMLNWKPKIKVYAFGNLCAGKALYQNEEKLFLMVLNWEGIDVFIRFYPIYLL